jgi:NitT/TauT family transport system substrate-binding protein
MTALRAITLSGAEHAAEGETKFTRVSEQAGRAKQAFSTKRLTIVFPSGSATLDENAKYIIKLGFVDTAKAFANARIRIEGNTDNVGDREMNLDLSKRRAQAVANYLINEYRFSPNRFVIVGNGPDKNIADNGTEEGRSKNRRTDFELLND